MARVAAPGPPGAYSTRHLATQFLAQPKHPCRRPSVPDRFAPLYLIISVVLSFSAAWGLVALVFVDLAGNDGMQFILPFLLFVFLMALGFDYNILVMRGIREEAQSQPLRTAVREAISRTGGTVTAAGMILAGSFALLAMEGNTDQVRQVGFGVAAGILMDAFLIRTLLIPAPVVLLGGRELVARSALPPHQHHSCTRSAYRPDEPSVREGATMKALGDHGPVRPSGRARTDEQNGDDRSAVVGAVAGNERLTALAGGVLLVLIVVEIVTSARLRTLLSTHVFVGVLLAGPLIVKLGSTGYRFLRYYTRSPAFVRRGPPRLALRVLAPLLIATTLVVIGSGIGLVVTGPRDAGLLLPLHGFSVLIWLPLIAVHVFAHIRRVPRLVTDDWSKPSAEQTPGRGRRLGLNLGALMLGALAAILLLPGAAPWIAWSQTNGTIPAPMIVGTIVAILALLATRLLRWW